MFPPNSYVVLEIPPPHSDEVLAIRERHRDFFRLSLPAETTVSGSSGTGPIASEESMDRVVATLDRIAAETTPIRTSFGPVRRFAQSDVFYLSLRDERPLRELHSRLASSGLRFETTPFEFTPHCTLRTRSPVSEQEATELLALRVEGEFILDTLSLYQLAPVRQPLTRLAVVLCLLHRVRLTGQR